MHRDSSLFSIWMFYFNYQNRMFNSRIAFTFGKSETFWYNIEFPIIFFHFSNKMVTKHKRPLKSYRIKALGLITIRRRIKRIHLVFNKKKTKNFHSCLYFNYIKLIINYFWVEENNEDLEVKFIPNRLTLMKILGQNHSIDPEISYI